tara:strand:- start:286 stop:762 length:477 start_codon:yes stop_codon:yes gene_type:complete
MTTTNDRQIGGEHYKHSEIQHWDWAWKARLDSFQYPITKYVARWKNKNGFEDLDKAVHYLEKYIEVVEDKVYVDIRGDEKQIFSEWSNAEKLDETQSTICWKISSWIKVKLLADTLEILRAYIEAERGGEPGPSYTNQDRQDVTIKITGVSSEGEGGL